MEPGLLVAELAEDGPHLEEADRWVRRRICERCWLADAYDDGLCSSCIDYLYPAGRFSFAL